MDMGKPSPLAGNGGGTPLGAAGDDALSGRAFCVTMLPDGNATVEPMGPDWQPGASGAKPMAIGKVLEMLLEASQGASGDDEAQFAAGFSAGGARSPSEEAPGLRRPGAMA